MLVNNKDILIEEINIKWGQDALEKLSSEIETTKLLAIGEVHGVKENSNFYYTIAKKFNFEVIALEFPTDLKSQIERYLKEGIFPDHYTLKELDDGRVSYEMLAFLKSLYDEGIIKSIICFDNQIEINNWNERDLDYADQFLDAYDPQYKTLIIAGRYHVRTKPFTANFEKGELYGMCHHLKKKVGDFPVCNINYSDGKFYNFGVQEFDIDESSKSSENFSFSMESPMRYKFLIKNASPITIF